MKFHRINGKVRKVDDNDDAATTASGAALIEVLNANPPNAQDPLRRGLPFQPRSYRDFMLFEAHYYGVAMGMTQLYRPAAYYLARLYGLLTGGGGEFPLFKPSALWYSQPIWYQSNHLAFVADGAPVHCPAYAEYLDVELELGVVLGRELYNATPQEAEQAIAGFCVFNDFSVRNGQMAEMASGFGPQHSKCFANSISSIVVSADEIFPVLHKLAGRVVVNGDVVSECRADKWQFTMGEALAHASKATRLFPGEFFGSGTFPGGAGIEHARFRLQVGDTVRLEIDGIGSVTNTIVAET
ncbi:hypothetical protein PFICI_03541 [Pestalotiopsis fici W106-1]|uniref:Fumarylacetoacetase-like C-terminal domain-containing protein n=1 Tax=Pestalotiopsis fici (strain W106-1 / CGMCC3.15140) TaxID=1229662 RepID=W3XJT2_PESFW|nr:uncharacterized protein PFICI_03541 [Pestalotiopsis fici W106-1]ETS85516.1 hypothetical protein PFICI_03541 [Pestalotiopsis fici W106-1]